MELERFEDESASLSLQAAGGNTRAARKLRVKSQLRDKKGRWVEMGRRASIDVKINGRKTKVQGKFVGSDPKAPGVRGLFLVEADEARGIKRGVYSFKGRAVNQVLASIDPEYLEEQGIKDPNRDVNGNLIGATLDEDIEEIGDVDFEEAGELDEALASGKLSSDEVAQAFNERSRAGAHESYNVVATLEEADTEVLTEEQLGDILDGLETVRPEITPDDFREVSPDDLKPRTREVEPVSDDFRDGVGQVPAPPVRSRPSTHTDAPRILNDDQLKAEISRQEELLKTDPDGPDSDVVEDGFGGKTRGEVKARLDRLKEDSSRRVAIEEGRKKAEEDVRNASDEEVLRLAREEDAYNRRPARTDGMIGRAPDRTTYIDEANRRKLPLLQIGEDLSQLSDKEILKRAKEEYNAELTKKFRARNEGRSEENARKEAGIKLRAEAKRRGIGFENFNDPESMPDTPPPAFVPNSKDPQLGARLETVVDADGNLIGLQWKNPNGTTTPYIKSRHGGSGIVQGFPGISAPDAGKYWTGVPGQFVFELPKRVGTQKAPTPSVEIVPAEASTETKNAGELVPGDEVKMPDGRFLTVKRNSSTDSGPLVSFDDGTRRGSFRVYDEDDVVEVKTQEPVSEPESEPAPEAEDSFVATVQSLIDQLPDSEDSLKRNLQDTIDFYKRNGYTVSDDSDLIREARTKLGIEQPDRPRPAPRTVLQDTMRTEDRLQRVIDGLPEGRLKNELKDALDFWGRQGYLESEDRDNIEIAERLLGLEAPPRIPVPMPEATRTPVSQERLEALTEKLKASPRYKQTEEFYKNAIEKETDPDKKASLEESLSFLQKNGYITDDDVSPVFLTEPDVIEAREEVPFNERIKRALDLLEDGPIKRALEESVQNSARGGFWVSDDSDNLRDAEDALGLSKFVEVIPEEATSNIPPSQHDETKVRAVLKELAEYFTSQSRSFQGLDILGFVSQETEDPDVIEAIDMAYFMSDIIERSDSEDKAFLYNQLVSAIRKNQADKVALRPTEVPRAPGRADTVRKITARKEGATIDPINMRQPRTGVAVAVQNTNEEVADALFFNMYLGDLIVADYVERNKDRLRDGFKLGTWHDKDNNEVTFDIVEVFPEGRIEQATTAGQERNQQGIFNLKNKDYIPTGGTGDRGRARRQREAQRQTGDGRGAGPELGQPEPIGEVREGQEPTPGDAEADGSGRDQLTIPRDADALLSVPASQRGDLDYGELKFDLASLNARQRQILKKIEIAKRDVFKNVTEAARKGELQKFERNLTWGKALKDTFSRVFGDLSNGIQLRFGQGEQERLKNMTFFTNTERRDENGKLLEIDGVYVAKNGEAFSLKYSGDTAKIFRLGPDGRPSSSSVAHVSLKWYGENSRGDENENYVSIGYLSSNDGGKGLAGAVVTFARYVVESSGKKFAHSYNLTPPGANNSKTIEPGDPRRHHYSQAEKVLQVMKAPTIDVLNSQGWFTGQYKIFAGDYLPTNMERRFLSPLDVSGRKNNVNLMLGPVYKVDKGLYQVLNGYRSNLERQRTTYNSEVTAPAYLQKFIDDGSFGSYRLQFDIEELNWQDGPSKDSVIKKLKDTEDMLTSVQELFSNIPASQRVGYIDYSAGLQVDTLKANYASIREGLEADVDFDSKRLPRPSSIDISLPKKVELKMSAQAFREVDQNGRPVNPAFEGIDSKFDLQNFDNINSSGGAYSNLTKSNYGMLLNKPVLAPPAGWVTAPSVLARRFSTEQLRESLESLLKRNASTEPPVTGEPSRFYAELDFRREFSSEPKIANVSALAVARALFKKSPTIDGVEFKEYLAEQIDKAFGIELNIKNLEAEKESSLEFFKEMDNYLKSIGETREESVEDKAEKAGTLIGEDGAKSVYDSDIAVLRSEGFIDQNSREEYMELSQNNALIDNETFDELPNGLGQILSEPLPAASEEEVQKLYEAGIKVNFPSEAARTISSRHRKEDLIEAFKDAIIRGNSTIRLEHPYEGYYSSKGMAQLDIDIRRIRDVLQFLSVDTNGLIKSEVIPKLSDSPNLSPEQVKELHRQGFLEPRSISDIVAKANEVVDLDGLVSLNTFRGGSKPELMSDPVSGKKYVVKRYTSSLLAETEITTQALYQAAGINASSPRFGRKSNDSSGYFVVTDYIEGMDNSTYRDRLIGIELDPDGTKQAEAREAVMNGLPIDLLVDNLDGPFNSGNILYDADGGYLRIDGGGGLLSDPSDQHGNKNSSRRYNAMKVSGWDGEATEEQLRVIEIAKRDGSFEGQGIEFGYDFYLNQSGWHWNWNGGMREAALEGFDEDAFKQRVRDSLLSFTPDKITEVVDGMPITADPRNKEKIKEALIYRRSHILNKFGIEDTYDFQEKDLESVFATDADRERLSKYIAEVFKNEYSMDRIPFDRAVNSSNTTKAEMEKAIEEIRALIPEKTTSEKENEVVEWVESEIVEIVSTSTEKPDTDDLPVDELEDFDTSLLGLSEVKPGDIVDDPFNTTENGRVIFNVKSEDGVHSVGIRNNNGELFVTKQDPSVLQNMRTVKRYTDEAKIPAETEFNASRNELRQRFMANIKNRSNSVIQAVKDKYVNHSQLANGDLVVSSRVFVTAGGRTYKYQLVVHRKADEEFVAYAREWEIGRDGAAIGPVRVNKMTTPTHSPKALLNKIAPLVKGTGVGQGVYGRNPRNWFNQGRSIEGEVTDPRTGMPIPASLSADPTAQFVEDTGIQSTGDSVKDAIISYVGRLVSRGITASDIYRRLARNNQNIFSRGKILDIIERVESNRAFPGINQVPYLSRNKRDIVRVGDRVRHYAPNGTIKEGVVRLRRPLSVNRKPNGDYNYTDVLVVKFDGIPQGTPIVAKHLEIINRSDGEAPDLGGEIPAELPRNFTPEMMPNLPAHWTATIAPGDSGNVRFDGPDDAPLFTISRIMDPFGRERFILHKYASKNEGRTSRDAPQETSRFANLSTAVATAELNIDSYEEAKAERNETPEPSSESVKFFQDENGDTDLNEFVEALKKNISDSPCSLTASVEACDITQAMRVKTVMDGQAVEVNHGEISGVDAEQIPTYWVFKTKFGLGRGVKKIGFWLDKNSVGDMSKIKWLNVPAKLTAADAPEFVRKNAEERIDFARGIPGNKTTRTLSIDLGNGETFTEEVDFVTWKMLSLSAVSKSHFTLGDDGTIKVSEGRLKYYQEQVAFHLSGIEPPKGRNPIMFVFGGSPASGKGGFTNKKKPGLADLVKGETPTVRDFNDLHGLDSTPEGEVLTAVKIDPDVFKIRLPEVRMSHIVQIANRLLDTVGLPRLVKSRKNDETWANDSHEESSLMAKMVTKAAQDAGLDIVLDAVNAEKSKVKKKADQARALGYKIVGRYLEASFKDTLPDAVRRSFNTGRKVPLEVQLESLDHLTKSLSSGDGPHSNIWDVFDEFELYHREKGDFTEIATWKPDQKDPSELNFTGKTLEEIQRARDLHEAYVGLARLPQAEKEALLEEIKKDAEQKIKDAKKRQELISSGRSNDLADPKLANATAIEQEMIGMMKALEVRYPEYSVKNLGNILRNLIDDLGTGKVSDKEFAKLIGEAVSDFTKDKENPDLRDMARTLVDSTNFFKKDMVG